MRALCMLCEVWLSIRNSGAVCPVSLKNFNESSIPSWMVGPSIAGSGWKCM